MDINSFVVDTLSKDTEKLIEIAQFLFDSNRLGFRSHTTLEQSKPFAEMIRPLVLKFGLNESARVISANHFHVNSSYISRIINNEVVPSFNIVRSLAIILNLSIFECYLLSGFLYINPDGVEAEP